MSMPTWPKTRRLAAATIGVARPDDLGDRRDAGGAVGQRRDRLRAADPVDLVDAGEPRGGQDERIDLAARRRHRP